MFGLKITGVNTWIKRYDGNQSYLQWIKWTHGRYGESLL